MGLNHVSSGVIVIIDIGHGRGVRGEKGVGFSGWSIVFSAGVEAEMQKTIFLRTPQKSYS